MMMPVVQQIVPGLIILCAAKVFAQVGPESFGHECQDDEKDWMKGSQGSMKGFDERIAWFFVKCDQGEAKACGFDIAKQKPNKPSTTLCPGEYYEPSGRKEVFACTLPIDAGATSKRTLIARHYSLDNDMEKLAQAIEEMRLQVLKAKPTPEYTTWKKQHDEWKIKYLAWKQETWKHDQWQAGYDKWKKEQDKEAEKLKVKLAQILKKPEYGEKEPDKPQREPIEPASPARIGGRNWMDLGTPVVTALRELGLQRSQSGKCTAVA